MCLKFRYSFQKTSSTTFYFNRFFCQFSEVVVKVTCFVLYSVSEITKSGSKFKRNRKLADIFSIIHGVFYFKTSKMMFSQQTCCQRVFCLETQFMQSRLAFRFWFFFSRFCLLLHSFMFWNKHFPQHFIVKIYLSK